MKTYLVSYTIIDGPKHVPGHTHIARDKWTCPKHTLEVMQRIGDLHMVSHEKVIITSVKELN